MTAQTVRDQANALWTRIEQARAPTESSGDNWLFCFEQIVEHELQNLVRGRGIFAPFSTVQDLAQNEVRGWDPRLGVLNERERDKPPQGVVANTLNLPCSGPLASSIG